MSLKNIICIFNYLRLSTFSIDITIFERDAQRCLELSELLPRAAVIHGEAGNLTFLEKEGIAESDALLSLTDTDEQNVIVSLYAESRKYKSIFENFLYFGGVSANSSKRLKSQI